MIGNWDNSKCIFAVLPQCLRNGSHPRPVSSGYFPMYNGPMASRVNTANFSGKRYDEDNYLDYDSESEYAVGRIDVPVTDTDIPALSLDAAPEMTEIFSPSSKMAIEHWVYYDTAVHGGNNVSLIDLKWADEDPAAISTNNSSVFIVGSSLYFVINNANIIPERGSSYKLVMYTMYTGAIGAFSTSGLKHIVMVKDGTSFRAYVNGVQITEILQEIPWMDGDGAPVNPAVNYGPSYTNPFYMTDLYSLTVYGDALTDQEIQANYALGPGLGGLKGIDNGDGTMQLVEEHEYVSSIGIWDTSNVLFAMLPECLKNGDAPLPFYEGTFPLWLNKDKGASALFYEYAEGEGYVDGKIITTANEDGTLDVSTPSFVEFESPKERTIMLTFDIDGYPDNFGVMHSVVDGADAKWSTVWQENVGANVHRIQSVTYAPGAQYDGGTDAQPLSGMSETKRTMTVFLRSKPSTPSYSLAWYLDRVKMLSNAYATTYGGAIDADAIGLGNLAMDIIGLPGHYNIPAVYNLKAFVVYDKFLDDNDMESVVNLGADMGELVGTDNGDGTMALSVPVRPERTWDKSDVILSLLPECWKNGQNPAPNGVEVGRFPVYNGPLAQAVYTSSYAGDYMMDTDPVVYSYSGGNCQYNDGMIKMLDDPTNRPRLFLDCAPQMVNMFSNTSKYSFEFWLERSISDKGSWVHATHWADSVGNPYTYGVGISTTGKPFLYIKSNQNFGAPSNPFLKFYRTAASELLTTGGLVHVVFIKYYTNILIYVNGVKQTVVDLDFAWKYGAPFSPLTGYSYVGIASGGSSTNHMDNIRAFNIYGNALTDEEVLNNYLIGADMGGLSGFDYGII